MAKMKVRTHRRVWYTIEIEGKEWEVQHDPCEHVDPIVRKLEDGRTVIGYLSDDTDPLNPREENDNFGTMTCFHSRYNLGDKSDSKTPNELWRELLGDDYERIDEETDAELSDWFEQNPNAKIGNKEHKDKQREVTQKFKSQIEALLAERYAILPLFLYDHSGITMSTSSGMFRACDSGGWDWGVVGWIYVSKEKVLENWSVKGWDDPVHYSHDNTTKTARERAIEILVGEVEEYDHHLTGECFGVCVETFDKEGNLIEDDACWGFLGADYAKESLAEQVESTVKHLTKKEAS